MHTRPLCCLLKAKSSVSMPEWRNWCVNTKIKGSPGLDQRAPHTFMSFTSLDSTSVQSGAAVAAILVTVQGGGGCSTQDGARQELLYGAVHVGWGLIESCWTVRSAQDGGLPRAARRRSGRRLNPTDRALWSYRGSLDSFPGALLAQIHEARSNGSVGL
jgi:hypothetical protein